jgi:antirestriction protein ArdC
MVFTFQPLFFAGLSGYIAEMASAFACASLGIQPTVRHADYIGAWLQVLREDEKAIFRAASAASRACDFLLAGREDQPNIGGRS